MTLGQLNIHKWFGTFSTERGVPAYGMQVWRIRPTTVVTVADIADTFAVLLARHEGLRTMYLDGHRQRVVGSGELPLHVLPVDDTAGPDACRQALDQFVTAQPHDPKTQLPVCVALAVRAGQVLTGVVRYSHLAVDRRAVVILGQEIEDMIGDPALRVVGAPRHQPIEQAEAERGPSLRQRTDNTLNYWRERLHRMPANPYASTRNGAAEESGAMEMTSTAGAAGLSRIAARTSLNPADVVLAAVLCVLSERTGCATQLLCMLSGNRFERRLVDYIGTLAMSSLFEVECGAATFDRFAARVRTRTVRASLNAYYDAYRLHAIGAQVEYDRGIGFNYFPPMFNNVATHSQPRPAGDVVTPTEFAWRGMPPTPAQLRFDLWQTDGVLAMEAWTGNTGRVGRDEVTSILLAVERLLMAAAAGDLSWQHMREIIDLPPIARTDGWLFIDSCWVELAEVQHLVEDALAPACVRVFGDAGGRPLVAYVTATESIRTPADAHTRCMARISAYATAMTPRHYVLCGQAPAGGSHDLSAWQRQPVLCQGPGRDVSRHDLS